MLTIGLAQLKGTYLNKAANIATARSVLKECQEKAVDLVIFPELYLTGYAIDGRVEELAETIDGPSIKSLCQAAKDYQVGIVVGFPEKEGDLFYNSAAFIQKDGVLQGVYRKVQLFEWEHDIFTPGKDAPVFEIEGGKLALMMTFDAGFPEMARISALGGAEMIVVLAAHVVPYQVYHKIMMRARALENQVFIAVVNKVGLEKKSVYFGESAIISPNGDYITKVEHKEKVIIESVDLSLVYKIRAQLSMDYLNSRNVAYFKRNGLCE